MLLPVTPDPQPLRVEWVGLSRARVTDSYAPGREQRRREPPERSTLVPNRTHTSNWRPSSFSHLWQGNPGPQEKPLIRLRVGLGGGVVGLAQSDWAHLCDHAFYDEYGKPCLIGIFRAISVPEVPAVHPSAALVFSLKGDPNEKVEVRVQLVRSQEEKPLIDFENTVDMGPGGNQITVVNLRNTVLPGYGAYEVHLLLNGQVAERVPFDVTERMK